ncbi:MAG: N-acetyltransferase [Burkholderiaceae bacterium]|nr:N-acetyltransferase [Burkholderiaceae bacterium]
MKTRAEVPSDWLAVHALNEAAFETSAEANLVDALRKLASPYISIVAEEDGAIVGHIMFTQVALTGHPSLQIMGLAPMAVAPEYQRRGIGSVLVHAGLEQCMHLGIGAVVVLGHPDYYPRFGFLPSARYGISCEYDVPEEVFIALELQPNYLQDARGKIKFHAAFGNA